MTASEIILKVLKYHNGKYLATHEITAFARSINEYISDNAASTRLNELDREYMVIGRYREGKRFKEWAIATADTVKASQAKPQAAPWFFYSTPHSAIPSCYFTKPTFMMAKLRKLGITKFYLWQGSHDAPQPYPYEGEN